MSTATAIYKTAPWAHQLTAHEACISRPASLLAMDMGTGKSKVAIDLVVNWECRTLLIVCPKSVMNVWRREFAQHMRESAYRLLLPRGATVAQKTLFASSFIASQTGVVLNVLVINYESAWRKAFAEWSLQQDWDCVVLDESHRIKANNSKVSKYCGKLGLRAERRLCLTGRPMPHSPLDVFGQFRFLQPTLFGTSWWQFRNHYAARDNPYIPQQITSYRNQPELQKRFALITYLCTADEVLDLPEVQHHERTFSLCPEAVRAYRELENELITMVGDGRITTAANALVRLLRLQQLTSGYLAEDNTGVVTQIDTGKLDLLAELLEDIGKEPVVVFCRFRPDLANVQRVAEKLGRRYGEVSGQRNDLTIDATMPEGVDVLGVQIQSGSVGINLTRARYAIYYSLGYSLGDYEQSLARLHRPGQTRPVNYYHLICEKSVDQRVYGALRKRKNVIDAVLEGLKGDPDETYSGQIRQR